MKKLQLLLLFGLIAHNPAPVHAGWSGPGVVASGTWGNAEKQFTVESTDMGDIYPTEFFVLDDGTVVIEDGKLKVYRNGAFAEALHVEGRILFCDQAIVVIPWAREDGKPVDRDLSFRPSGGRTGWKVPAKLITGHLDWINRDCTFVTKDEEKIYRRYSPTGKLIETRLHPERIRHERLNDGHYRISVTYDDLVYTFIRKDQYAYGRYVQDGNRMLYGISGGSVDVLNQCGKVIDSMRLPENMKFGADEDDNHNRNQLVHDEYGEPFVDAYGNVYTWKRTPAGFSILKWKRQAGIVAPPVPDPPLEPIAHAEVPLENLGEQRICDPGLEGNPQGLAIPSERPHHLLLFDGDTRGFEPQRRGRHPQGLVLANRDDRDVGGHTGLELEVAVVDADHDIVGDDVLDADRGVPHLHHGAFERGGRIGVHRELGLFPLRHAADVRLAHVRVHLHLGQVL